MSDLCRHCPQVFRGDDYVYFNKEFGRSRTVDTTLPCESHDYIPLYMYVVPYVTRVSSRGGGGKYYPLGILVTS